MKSFDSFMKQPPVNNCKPLTSVILPVNRCVVCAFAKRIFFLKRNNIVFAVTGNKYVLKIPVEMFH